MGRREPRRGRCVTNECWKPWQVARSSMPASLAACVTARCAIISWRCGGLFVRHGSARALGTHCHRGSFGAAGYLLREWIRQPDVSAFLRQILPVHGARVQDLLPQHPSTVGGSINGVRRGRPCLRTAALSAGSGPLLHPRLDIVEQFPKRQPQRPSNPDDGQQAGVADSALDVGDVVPREFRRLGKVVLAHPTLLS